MHKRYWTAAITLLTASVAGFAKEQPNGPVTDSIKQTQGLSVEDAQRQIAYTDQAAELQERLMREEPNSFGGLYIENAPQFRIVVLFTGNAEALLAKYTQDPVFHPMKTNKSLTALRRKQDAILKSLKGTAPEYETDIDIRSNKVKVRHPSRAVAKDKLAGNGVTEEDVEIEQTTDFPKLTATNRGGYQLRGDTQTYIAQATSGFNVVDQQGNKGTLTAAHEWECAGEPAGCNIQPSYHID